MQEIDTQGAVQNELTTETVSNTVQMVHKLPRRICKESDKIFASRQTLGVHKRRSKTECGEKRVPSMHLKWNGKGWETLNRDIHYQLNLGRDLSSLLKRAAIKEDALNNKQKEYIRMYKDLFIEKL